MLGYPRAMAGAGAGGALAGMMIARNVAATQKGLAAASVSWKELAGSGLTLRSEETSGLDVGTGAERPVLEGTVGGTAVRVHVKTDMVHFGWTEIVATRAARFEGKVGVHPSPGGVLGYLRSWIGQDIVIGDEPFDAAYLITGKPEEAAASLLVPSVRELVVHLGQKLAALSVEGDHAKVILSGVEAEVEVLRVAIDLAVAAATWAPA